MPGVPLQETSAHPLNEWQTQRLLLLRKLKPWTNELAKRWRRLSDELQRVAQRENSIAAIVNTLQLPDHPATTAPTRQLSRPGRGAEQLAALERATREGLADFCGDAGANTLSVSDALAQLSGHDLRGMGYVDVVHPDDRETMFASWERMQHSGSLRILIRMKMADNKYQRVLIASRAHYDQETGLFVGNTGVVLPTD